MSLKIKDLVQDLERHLALQKRAMAKGFRYHVKRLLEVLGEVSAEGLEWREVQKYQELRLSEGKSPRTVNNEVSLLRRAYSLAARHEKVRRVPVFDLLPGNFARTDFFTVEEFHELLAHLNQPVRDIAEFAWLSGWRRGEILAFEWSWVGRDFVRLPAEFSKNREPRLTPVEGGLAVLLARRRRVRNGPFVFHRRGRQVRSFDAVWYRALKEAGLSGRTFHGLRRSFVRNCDQAGISRKSAMALSGHKTATIHDQYNVKSEDDLRDAARRFHSFLAGGHGPTNMLPFFPFPLWWPGPPQS